MSVPGPGGACKGDTKDTPEDLAVALGCKGGRHERKERVLPMGWLLD